MSAIKEVITSLNDKKEKALTVFLTAGYPFTENFSQFVLDVFNAGADIIELGIPFSDPLADGPVIQKSSKTALDNGVNLEKVLEWVTEIKDKTNKPLVLMGYANPIAKYGINRFFRDFATAAGDGLIVPDIPVDEYHSFYPKETYSIDKILLTTPTSTEERIGKIDELSEGFVYCVSVTGTTGVRSNFNEETNEKLRKTYSLINKNKMMIGFGISKPEDIRRFKDFSDGFIIGSAAIRTLEEEYSETGTYVKTLKLVSDLKSACKTNI